MESAKEKENVFEQLEKEDQIPEPAAKPSDGKKVSQSEKRLAVFANDICGYADWITRKAQKSDSDSTPNKSSETKSTVVVAQSDPVKIKEEKAVPYLEELTDPVFEISPWRWSVGKSCYYAWRFPAEHFKIKLAEDPATGLVYATLTLTIPKPTNDEITAICAIGDMYDQLNLEDQVFTWEISVPNAVSRDAVTPLKSPSLKGFVVNTAFKLQETEW
jgi:hypothetical protein